MIRFIDIGKQIGGISEEWPREFSFFNTVTSRFLEFNGNQVWESRGDLEADYDGDPKMAINGGKDRLLRLIPDYVP